MKSLRYYFIFFLLTAVIISTSTACSSDDQSTEFNFLVLDFNTNEPIEGAEVTIKQSVGYGGSFILVGGATDVNGKVRLSVSESDMKKASHYAVYIDNYWDDNRTFNGGEIYGLDLSQEIVVRFRY